MNSKLLISLCAAAVFLVACSDETPAPAGDTATTPGPAGDTATTPGGNAGDTAPGTTPSDTPPSPPPPGS